MGRDRGAGHRPRRSAAPEPPAPKTTPDQLDSLVAPIALYPDPLLAQTLVASTYPLEIIQLQQWLDKNKSLKDKALADAVAKQPWDPAIQSMAAVPDVVKRLADDIQWTTDLGNAFLDQQADVMDAVQRMRKKAQGTGALAILRAAEGRDPGRRAEDGHRRAAHEPRGHLRADLQPDGRLRSAGLSLSADLLPASSPGAYLAAAAISFGVGMAMGAAWGGSCCGCGWGGNNVNINVNNNFNRNANINTGGNNNWQHNSQHRGGAPYSNKATASKYGGQARGESRQASGRSGGASPSNRARAAPAGAPVEQGPATAPAGAGAAPGGSAGRAPEDSAGPAGPAPAIAPVPAEEVPAAR